MSQTLSITTKAKATAILNQTPGAYRFPYCTGKYKWSGSARDWAGQEIQTSDSIKAIYVERRQDQHGPYAKMMCVTTNQ